MNEITKESKFLDAINRYAEQQKAQIVREIDDYKNAKIEQATEQGLRDAYELIQGDIAKRKSAIVMDTTKREREMRAELFAARSQITEQVFGEASERLKAFTASSDYDAFLVRSAEVITRTFGENACTVYLRPDDECKRALIKDQFPDGTSFESDPDINIGGIKAFCRQTGIYADDTIDTRLSDQHDWFISNAGLKVV